MPRRIRIDRSAAIAAVGGALVVSIVAFVLYAPAPPASTLPPTPGGSSTSVVVEGVDLMLNYTGASSDNFTYFSSPDCGGCPAVFAPGSTWDYAFNLTNNDSRVHRMTGLDVTPPFVLLVLLPELPIVLDPGHSVRILLQLDLPSAPGDYFLTGDIHAS